MTSIMVIDDDIQVRTVIREMLEGEGYEVSLSLGLNVCFKGK